jgi:copper transport protein
MRKPRLLTGRTILVALGVWVMALGAVLALASPASAHAAALGTEPAPGTTSESSPTRVLVRFGSPVEISLGAMRLVDATGANVAIGAASHPSGERNAIAADVPNLRDGGYVAVYQVTSADGHLTRGAFTFQVGRTSTPVAAAIVTKLSATSDKGPLAAVTALARLLLYAGVFLSLGGLLYVAHCWPDGRGDRRATLLIRIGALQAALASVALIALAAAQSSGRGMSGIADTTGWRSVLASHAGRWWLARTGGTALVLAATLAKGRALPGHHSDHDAISGAQGDASPRVRGPSADWRRYLAIVGATLVVAGMAKGGHGTSGRWTTLGVAATVVHVLAAAAWVGGLAMALVALSRPNGRGSIRRFSRLAFIGLVAVVVSGAAQSARQLRYWSAWSSQYGQALRSKLIVVAVLAAIGGASRLLLRRTASDLIAPADLAGTAQPGSVELGSADLASLDGASLDGASLELGSVASVTTSRGSQAVAPSGALRIRDLVGMEVLFAAGVLALTMSLINIPPPAAAVSKPFSTVLVVGTRSADIIVEPAQQGVNAVHVTVTNNDGSIRNPSAITIRMSLPSKDLPPISAEPTKRLANHASFENVVLPYPGEWTLETIATFAGETIRFSTTVKVR